MVPLRRGPRVVAQPAAACAPVPESLEPGPSAHGGPDRAARVDAAPPWAHPRCGRLGVWLGLLVLAGCGGARVDRPESRVPSLTLQPCQLRAPGSSQSLAADCGALVVRTSADPGEPNTLTLKVAVLAAVSRNAAPDPLYYLAGGPGQAASESFPESAAAFQRIRRQRDIVLIDQRGTGGSGALRCPAEVDDPEGSNVERAQAVAEWARACIAGLDADLDHYTTSDAVRDLEASAEALGYPQVNVYGISYGSRLAQAWARTHPERIRSLVLDGVVPLETALGDDIARDAQAALDLIFDRCASDPDCNGRFGRLAPRFERLMRTLERHPVRVVLDHPVRAEAIALEMDRDRAATVFRFASYAPETVALIPLLIDAAEGRADYRPLAAQYLLLSEALDQSIASGLHYAIVCSEDVPFLSADPTTVAPDAGYLADLVATRLRQVCDVWPAADLPPGLHEPLRGGPPSLLLSGAVDPVTPPRNAKRVATRLTDVLQLVAPGQGHGVVGRGCIPKLVAEFLDAGSGRGIDSRCVDAIEPNAFFLDPIGPAP